MKSTVKFVLSNKLERWGAASIKDAGSNTGFVVGQIR